MDGKPSIDGNLECNSMDLDGIIMFNGNVRVNGKADIDGVCKISDNFDTEELDFEGILTISKNMTVKNARIEGNFIVYGILNVGTLNLKFQNYSFVKECIGGKIKITRRMGITTYIWAGGKGFHSDLVEGHDIDLEWSDVKVVRGDFVKIGTECNVDRVEYRKELTVHPKAKVKETVKLT